VDGALVVDRDATARRTRARFAARATLRLAARFGRLADLRTARPTFRVALRTARPFLRPDRRTARLTLRAVLRRLRLTRRLARFTRRTAFLTFRLAAMWASPRNVVETYSRRTGVDARLAS